MDLSNHWPLSSLPHRLPVNSRGKRLHIATVYRWATHGLSGRKLKTIRVGGQIYTCDRWVEEFLSGGRESASLAPLNAARELAIDIAERELSQTWRI